ncbi:MAG: Dihydrofolate reductase homolog, partial [uncultured Phycisphaerae bacterium]
WVTPAYGWPSGCSPPASVPRSWDARAAPPASMTRSPSSTSRVSAPRSWVRGSSVRRTGRTTPTGEGGGAPTRPSTRRRSCSPIGRVPRSRWRAAPPSTSSTPHRPRRLTSPARRQAGRTCGSAVGRPLRATSSRRASSTTSTWSRYRSCSAAGCGCGTASKRSRRTTPSRLSRRPAASRTSRSRD